VNEIHDHLDGKVIAANPGERFMRGASLAGAPLG